MGLQPGRGNFHPRTLIGGPDALRVRNAALSLLREHGILKPEEIRLDLLAWHALGALVQKRPLRHCDARVTRRGRCSVIAYDEQAPVPQARFSVGHEMGHLVLHPDVNQLTLCAGLQDLWQYRAGPEEREANLFAVELLMPGFLFQPRCQEGTPSFELIEDLARMFQASLTATALRYLDFGLHDCCLVKSSKGIIQWAVGSEDFRWPVREGRLAPGSYAIDFTEDPAQATKHQRRVRTNLWLQGERGVGQLHEQSRVIAPGVVLTLLWVEPEAGGAWWGDDDTDVDVDVDLDPDHFTPEGRRRRW